MRTEQGRCIYCGVKVHWYAHTCGECYCKLALIRKIRSLVFNIKRRAEEEKKHDSG